MKLNACDIVYGNYLAHFGILGMKWGVRRYQNKDGTLTEEGRKRYYSGGELNYQRARKELGDDKANEMLKKQKDTIQKLNSYRKNENYQESLRELKAARAKDRELLNAPYKDKDVVKAKQKLSSMMRQQNRYSVSQLNAANDEYKKALDTAMKRVNPELKETFQQVQNAYEKIKNMAVSDLKLENSDEIRSLVVRYLT